MEIENVIIIEEWAGRLHRAVHRPCDLDPLVIEGWMWGGLLQQTTDVENYL